MGSDDRIWQHTGRRQSNVLIELDVLPDTQNKTKPIQNHFRLFPTTQLWSKKIPNVCQCLLYFANGVQPIIYLP